MSSAILSGTFIQSPESKVDQVGLSLSLKNISSTGVTLVFELKEKGKTEGLQYGEDFSLKVEKKGLWEDVPIILKGSYGFKAIAYNIPSNNTSEKDVNWNWLYGSLPPGHYKINKKVMDTRLNSGPVFYELSAQFQI